MTPQEAMQALPQAPQSATITLPDGTTPVLAVPCSAPYQQQGLETEDEDGNPIISFDWQDGSDYTLFWPVTDVQQEGPVTKVIGPRGMLELRRRQ